METSNILETLEYAKQQLTVGVKAKSISIIESIHDELWQLEYEEVHDENIKENLSTITGELKSAYKNRDFGCAKYALEKLNDLIVKIKG